MPADWSSPSDSLDAGVIVAPLTNSASTEVCLAPGLPPKGYEITATADDQTASASLTVCSTTTHLVVVLPPAPTIECGVDGGSRCVPLTAEAQVRYCSTSGVVNVNTGAAWTVSPADAGLVVVDGVSCFVEPSCPQAPSQFTVTGNYGGHAGQSQVTVR